MDRMTSLRVFREVVDAGSFSAAADRLSLSASMASKHVSELEHSLGARLLHRSSRHLSLTEAGEVYYTQCRLALETLEAAESAIGEQTNEPRGELKVTAPGWCANQPFAQLLTSYRRRYPQVVLDMRLDNRKVDLVAEGFDLALRATFEPSLTHIARPLCEMPFLLAISPDYLKRIGPHLSSLEVLSRGVIMPSDINLEKLPPPITPDGQPLPIPPITMRTDDFSLIYHATLAGNGVSYLPEWMIADDLATGRLVTLLDQPRPPPMPIHAVYMSRRHLPSKLRTFIDHLAAALNPASLIVAQTAVPNAHGPH
jgi:DNA-binding transcriptional LysR family regulator